jgi:hypothetical protein
MIFKAAEGLGPVEILPFPDGKNLLITTGNDQVLGSTSLSLYRVNLATHSSQKIGELSGSPTSLVWNDPGRPSCVAAPSTTSPIFGSTVWPTAT